MMHLPDPHTDFVFTLRIESYALIAGLILIVGIALWMWLR
jgi:cell division protein FtsW (lipid II flippase)